MHKKRALTVVLTLSTMMILSSCDCLQNVTGTVIDAETNQPIQGAQVHKQQREYDKDETDENGKFAIESISGGLFDCPPMTIVVSKDGYETKTVEIDNAEDKTIKLKSTE